MNTNTKIGITAIACLAIGYFSGREYLKYQIRSTMHDAAAQIQSSLAGVTSAPAEAPVSAPTAEKTEEQPITVSLEKKGFKPKDIYNHDFEDDITFNLQFANKSGKEIRAFDGVVVFTDLLDNRILGLKTEINERIAEGQTLTWPGVLEYNQFIDSHQRLRSEPKENLKVSFLTGKILFADGTSKEY